MTQPPKAIILLSGGLDSATCLAIAKSRGFAPIALSFSYGQRHAAELNAARRVAQSLGAAKHIIADLDPRLFGGSALTDDIPVPKDRDEAEMGAGIPVTYVPARNTVFLAMAMALAEVEGACDIFIGVNAVDYSGYPDCRPAFIEAFQTMANLATKAAIEDGRKLTIHTPLIALSKADIVRTGLSLGVDYGLTVTCYDPSPEGEACGHCDACTLRLKGFAEAGSADPAPYRAR
ncbi:MAG: 7-cyano-7-deazaguanine synthase QueC [Rhodospirillaceae bacterium]|nr:7-cyano-7-deazaguanine synthase QueC [Rhodospirillaceae bacterium]